MKKYFVEGKEITEVQAKEIEAANKKYMSSDDMNEWLKCQFVIVINN